MEQDLFEPIKKYFTELAVSLKVLKEE